MSFHRITFNLFVAIGCWLLISKYRLKANKVVYTNILLCFPTVRCLHLCCLFAILKTSKSNDSAGSKQHFLSPQAATVR